MWTLQTRHSPVTACPAHFTAHCHRLPSVGGPRNPLSKVCDDFNGLQQGRAERAWPTCWKDCCELRHDQAYILSAPLAPHLHALLSLPSLEHSGHVLLQLIGCYFRCWRSRRRQLLKFAYQKRPGHSLPVYMYMYMCRVYVYVYVMGQQSPLQALAVPTALWIYEHNINLFLQTFHVFVWATKNLHERAKAASPPSMSFLFNRTRTTKGLLCQFGPYTLSPIHTATYTKGHIHVQPLVSVCALHSTVLSSTFKFIYAYAEYLMKI